MEYLLILLAFLLSAVIIKRKYSIRVYNTGREMLTITAVIFVVCIVWDYFAVWRGHWGFPGPGLVGVSIGWLPIEEFLFILIMPFWIITVYKLLHEKLKVR